MKLVASEHDMANKLWFLCTFRHEPRWSYRGQPLKVGGLKFSFTIQKDWVAQTVKTDVSLGYYDHLKRSVVVPDKQWYTPGMIDNEAWEETDKEWEQGKMEANTFRLNITCFDPICPTPRYTRKGGRVDRRESCRCRTACRRTSRGI